MHRPKPSTEKLKPRVKKGIEDLRNQIDVLDRGILGLLAQRMDLVKEIGQQKIDMGLPAYQSDRLAWLLVNRSLLGSQLGLPTGLIIDIYTRIHQESLQVQNQITCPSSKPRESDQV